MADTSGSIKREMSSLQVAEQIGVSVKTVQNWPRMGCPHSKRNGRLRWNADEVAHWMASKNMTGQQGKPRSVSSEEKLKWEIEKLKAMAQRHQLELDKARGLLLDKSEVEAANVKKLLKLKSGLMDLGASLAPLLVGKEAPEIKVLIDQYVIQTLDEFRQGA